LTAHRGVIADVDVDADVKAVTMGRIEAEENIINDTSGRYTKRRQLPIIIIIVKTNKHQIGYFYYQ
jgi:hypothetical protein